MEVLNLYLSISQVWGFVNFNNKHMSGDAYPLIDWKILVFSLSIAFAVWVALFVLQGIGLYTMAKRRNLKKKWLAFIPFANWLYVEKLAGNCVVFGQRIRKIGLITMIVQIINFLLSAAAVTAQIYLYYTQGMPANVNGVLEWSSLSGWAQKALDVYNVLSWILPITQLIYTILIIIVAFSLFKCYQPTRAYMWALLLSFMPMIRYILIFAFRKKEAIDYEEYMRKKREETYRMWQQYSANVGGAYAPRSPQTPPPSSQPQQPKEEPFEEFADDSANQEGSQPKDSTQSQDDGFFS